MTNHHILEKTVIELWHGCPLPDMVTDTGEPLHVVYPGRINSNGGSDFCDAVLSLGDTHITGNIEVHVSTSDWEKHKHHLDPKYNSIILHVVMWNDCNTPIVSENGTVIPTVALSDYFSNDYLKHGHFRHLRKPWYRCAESSHLSHHLILKIIHQAGMERYFSNVNNYANLILSDLPDQALYNGVSRTMGYSKNIEPFQRLVTAVPLLKMESMAKGREIDCVAFVIGTAGLLPSQCDHRCGTDDIYIMALEQAWDKFRTTSCLQKSDWNTFRIRPSNSPVRRIIALTCLYRRYKEHGLFAGLTEALSELSTVSARNWVNQNLVIQGNDYWRYHFGFNGKKTTDIALFGSERAGELALNVVLPFLYAFAVKQNCYRLKERAAEFYLEYPRFERNQVVTYMEKLLFPEATLKLTACHDQGLLYIYKKWCYRKECSQCAVSLNRYSG